MLRVQARPSSGDSDNDIDAAGMIQTPRSLILEWTSFWTFFISAREDLAKLQRQFRLTEGSRKQYADQATYALRKQQYVDTRIYGSLMNVSCSVRTS